MNSKIDFKKLQNHLKETGFIFNNSEIYGGLSNTYDYGPLGIMIINNLKNLWREEFINNEPKNFEIDVKTFLNPKVWEASGHVEKFSDFLVENKINNKRYRADHVIMETDNKIDVSKLTKDQMEKYLIENIKIFDNVKTDWSKIREFNLMFETSQGIIQGKKDSLYLRPELAQGIFINFKNVMKSMRLTIPFGIGQIGHSFRNEVTPRNYIFRTREFEQMELEYFTNPKEANQDFEYYKNKIKIFLINLGIKTQSFRFREHQKDELAHYAKKTTDVEYNFPFGWGEIIGLANRGDYDLKSHTEFSKTDFSIIDNETKKPFIPYVIEPSIGLDRLFLAILIDSYKIIKTDDKEYPVLSLNSKIAPYKVAILPLIKKIHFNKSKEIFNFIKQKQISAILVESSSSIGKKYLWQDGIGTPWCVTIDDQTLNNNTVTLRNRDTKKQIRIDYQEIFKYL